MPASSTNPNGLSPTLRALVRQVEAALGRIVAETAGASTFGQVEALRRDMVALREGRRGALARARRRLAPLDLEQRMAVARAYTLYLELINVCENAYRTHRLRQRRHTEPATPPEARAHIVWVLTAHPTESRSPANIALLRRVQALLVRALDRGAPLDQASLAHLLHLVWRAGTHPAHKPSVEDEAAHLFSLIDDPVIDELLALRSEGHRVRLRTWVGGDKDGHPGVGPEATGRSLALSRRRLLDYLEHRLLPVLERDIELLPGAEVRRAWLGIRRAVDALETVTIGDGRRVAALHAAQRRAADTYRRNRGACHPSLEALGRLLEQFPGLVIPLELREERGRFGAQTPIADMMRFCRDVARGGDVAWYVRGCVVSMASAAEDLWAAQALVDDVFSTAAIPVVPLFEMPDVLPRAPHILEQALSDARDTGAPQLRQAVSRHGHLEVMLGYSDTSKRMGVLASRMAIHDAMRAIERWAERDGISLLFFHGSGGSVGRGGGTIADQAASWPTGAVRVVKQTLQGEMVERTLATPEILDSQVRQIAAVQARPPRTRSASRAARRLATRSAEAFADLVGSPGLLELLETSTPYTRLGALNIGSRPVKRAGATRPGLESLRAIPWVLCWTQTRYLAHAWLGVGTAWREIQDDPEAKRQLLRACRQDPFLRSYLRQLRFTLAKTAPAIWREYAGETSAAGRAALRRLERERRDALDFAVELTGGELLADRRWLAESIYYRAPMIHPLNLLQVDLLRRRRLTRAEELLFRETVTGIAAGMLTTG